MTERERIGNGIIFLEVARTRECTNKQEPASREPSWTCPVEWDVFARIRRPLKLEAERIDGTDC
jgi:hypothetical protein